MFKSYSLIQNVPSVTFRREQYYSDIKDKSLIFLLHISLIYEHLFIHSFVRQLFNLKQLIFNEK